MANIKYISNYRYQSRYKKNKSIGTKKILGFLAGVVLYLLKTLAMVKDFILLVFLFLYKPIRKALSIFFHKVVVRIYTLYLKIVKRFGFEGAQNNFSLTLNQKLVHFLVITMTVLLLFVNLNAKTKVNASGFVERAHHTILAEIVQSEFGELYENDEQLIVETFDMEPKVQQSYLENLSGFRPQQKVSYEEEVEDELDLVNNNEDLLMRPNITKTTITKQDRTEIISYEVQPGDTISTIAQMFDISVYTILWENKLSSYSIIRPGDKLEILPMTGLSHMVAKNETVSSIAKKYSVEENVIVEQNKLAEDVSLGIGQKLLVPGGKKISAPAPVPTTYTGFSAIKNIVTAPSTQSSGNKMAWPTTGHTITQYYSWRHYGLDIADKTGTPLYAADSGTVEYVGWGTGYGNQIVIDHGGGKKTRYAHMSKFYVEKGDEVSKGIPIGEMGSTGWSTGSHVHFEIIINGTKYNPLDYIK